MPNVTSNNFRTDEEVERDRESAADAYDALHDKAVLKGSAVPVPCLPGCTRRERGGFCNRWVKDGKIVCRDFVTGKILNEKTT